MHPDTNNNNVKATHLFVWDNEPKIQFFTQLPMNDRPNVVVYSIFTNNQLQVQQFKELVTNTKAVKVFYSGECFMSESSADYIVGFAPSSWGECNFSILNRNLLTGEITVITKPVNPTARYIQIRLQDMDYITHKFGQIQLTPSIIPEIMPYTDLNAKWAMMRERLSADTQSINALKPKFACFIVSNGMSKLRNKFFEMMNKMKPVDSLGRYMRSNNLVDFILPDRVKQRDDYLAVISQYRYMITFENTSLPYYNTEKIGNAIAAGTVPIYWGDPLITEIYNPAAFIHVRTLPGFGEQMVEFIRVINLIEKLESDPELTGYRHFFTEVPCINPNEQDMRVQQSVTELMDI